MIDLSQLAEHMEVIGFDGKHVGTVDNVVIKLTTQNLAAQDRHHLIKVDMVGSIQDGKVMLNVSAAEAVQRGQAID